MAAKNKPAVYLDACCFIDVVKDAVGIFPDGRDDDVWHLKQLFKAHKKRDVIVVTSILSVAEAVSTEPGQAVVPTVVQEHFRSLLTSGQYVILQPQTPKTSTIVQDLRWSHGLVLKGQDALHIAAAIEYGVREFISTDNRLRRDKMVEASRIILKNHGMRFIRASQTSVLPDEYLQGDMYHG